MSEDTPTPDQAVDSSAQTPESPADTLPPNIVTVEDGEASTKKVSIEIPRERIDAKFDEIYGELHNTAQIPGFRIGRAPRRLIEKRFGKEAGEDVRNGLVSEALAKAIEDEDLKMLSEPDIKLDEIELPDSGPLTFSVEVEVAPEFELPEYKGIAVTEPSSEVTDERLDAATKEILSSRGALAPTEEPAVEGDHVVANIKIAGEGIDESLENAEYLVAGGAVMGVPLEDLAEKLTGATVGQTVTLEATVPETHEKEHWRGKTVTVAFDVQEVKRLDVPELTDEIAQEFGFEGAGEFKDYVSARLASQLQQDRQRSMRDQVTRYLLDNTEMELPPGVAARQTARVLQRRYIDLLYRGVPREQIDQNLEMLQAQAGSQAEQELKMAFILDEVAEAEGVTVEEGEINARISEMAVRSGRRPERLRSEMANQGNLGEVETQLREEKALDKLLEMAEITAADAGGESTES